LSIPKEIELWFSEYGRFSIFFSARKQNVGAKEAVLNPSDYMNKHQKRPFKQLNVPTQTFFYLI